jgi:hypothetical protein
MEREGAPVIQMEIALRSTLHPFLSQPRLPLRLPFSPVDRPGVPRDGLSREARDGDPG